ncbi:phospho-sugar mutase [Actinomadura sp. 9N407]|uniref:phospho-sugar mutase n=1 Tax=Actinomadura sp. 9N407 TaxID=3375154 RepID=UPI0037B5BFD9
MNEPHAVKERRRKQAEEWLAQDPDPVTRDELREILEAGDEAALADRFGARLEFGTAGLRGELGAGPNRMNRVTVMRAAAGLAARLRTGNATTRTGGKAPRTDDAATGTSGKAAGTGSAAAEAGGVAGGVVIGYDARYGSERFALDTAAVVTGAGLKAWLLPRTLPTPVLAFAVRLLGASAGVMVTASHNPPRDNGYKVYWDDGAQIVPPLDSEISAAIDAVGRVDALPLGDDWTVLGDEIVEAYLDALSGLPLGDARDVTTVYTPLHGVGREVLLRAFARAGFPEPTVVPEQAEPDPDFPTVAFPNPEEPGAMDLALDLARDADIADVPDMSGGTHRTGAVDLVIANDPDADRCAVAVPSHAERADRAERADLAGSAGRAGRQLTGDELGGLLAEHVLRNTPSDAPGDRLVVTTIVSSSLLARIAEAYGARSARTLTGFKWIMKAGDGIVYGYEEALGYSVGGIVRDKDGIGAALTIAAMAAEAKRDGRTLLDLLDDQARRYGLHATAQLSIRVRNLALIPEALERLRVAPPAELAGFAVERFDDLAQGVDGLPPTEGLRFELASSARIVVRPSGTEPKLKCYLEVVRPVHEDVAATRAEAARDLDALRDALSTALALD